MSAERAGVTGRVATLGVPRCAAVAAAVFVVSCPSLARAAPVHVAAYDCETVDVAEVERLLAIELSTVQRAPWTAPEVELRCAGEEVRVTLHDALTEKTLARSVRMPGARPLRSELLAFAISELFVASWLELLVAPPPPALDAPRAATAAAERRARAAVNASATPWVIAAEVALLVRAPRSRSLYEEALTLRVGVAPGSFRVFAAVGVDRGSTDAAGGSVAFVAERAGAGLGWQSPGFGALALHATMSAAVVALQAEGVGRAGEAEGASASGVGASFTAALGPAVRLGAVHLGLDLLVDVRVPSFVGRVTGGAPLSLGGVAPGLGAWVSYDVAPL